MLLKKLEEMSKRFEVVNELIQQPDLIKDQKKYKDTMREHSYLTNVMEAYEEYKKVLQGIEDSKLIITEEEDHDMKDMAREELKRLEEEQPVLENKIKMPSEIARETGYRTTQISAALIKMKEKNLVVCLNKNARKGRLYTTTDYGKEILRHYKNLI